MLKIFVLLVICLLTTISISAKSDQELVKENYFLLKEQIQADTKKDNALFDKSIDEIRHEISPGFNFGNSLDWSFTNNKLRRYKIRISIGYNSTEYFYYENYVNALGNLFTYQNHKSALQPFAKLELKQNENVDLDKTYEINNAWITVSNNYPAASTQEIKVAVKYFNVIDRNKNFLFNKAFAADAVPVNINSDGAVALSIPMHTTTKELLGNDVRILAGIQLEKFISDYKNDPQKVYRDTYNGEPATEEELLFLKKQGFKTIRLPVTWFGHMDSTGTVDPEWFEEVNRIVDRILKYDFYVILNIHHDAGVKGWIRADQDDFKANEYRYRYLILQIAERFKNYNEKLILSGPNEITNYQLQHVIDKNTLKSDIDTYNRINQIFVDEVRSTGYGNTNRFLSVGTWYTHVKNLPFFIMPEDSSDNKIFTEFHIFPNDDNFLPYADYLALDYLERNFKKYSDCNLLLSEFGIRRDESPEKKKEFLRMYMDAADKLEIPVLLWDDGGNISFMRKDAAEWDTRYSSEIITDLIR